MKRWAPGPARGVALVAVLWVLTLLATVATGLAVGARTEMALARNLEAAARAEAMADAGITLAVLGMLDRRRAPGEGALEIEEIGGESEEGGSSLARILEQRPELEEPLARRLGTEALIERLPLGESPWPVDGTPVTFAYGDSLLALAVQDEGGKIDLNQANDELLVGLFVSVGVGEDEAIALTDAIRDFTDDNDLARESGAEEAEYRAAGLPWGPKNARFQTPEELHMVLGMTPALYAAVKPAITVWSGRPGIDTRVAPAAALAALPGADEGDIEQLLSDRAAGVAQPQPLVAAEGFTSRSRGRIFTVRAQAQTADGATFVREAVLRLVGHPQRPYDVLSWERGAEPRPVPESALEGEIGE